MVLVRRIDTEGVALQRQGQLGLWAPCQGQEAAQVGTARAFRADDFVFPSYREIGVNYVRGAKPADFVIAWRGEEHSTYNPYDINTATPQIIIGAQALHAVGYAMGIQRDGTDQVAAAYFGDGAIEPGRRQRGDGVRVLVPRSRRLRLHEQPVGDLRARHRPGEVPDRRPRAGLRHPEHAGRRQRRPRVPRGDALGARQRPHAATAPRSSRRSPTAWARTRPRTTRPATATRTRSSAGAAATRSPASRRCCASQDGFDRRLRAPRSPPRPTVWAPTSAPRRLGARSTRADRASSTTSTTSRTPASTSSARSSPPTSTASLRRSPQAAGRCAMTQLTMAQGHQRRTPPRDGR